MLKEIDRALTSHGLIKVRAGGDDREAREAMLSEICDKLSCAPVHHLGKTLILFRQLPGNIKPAALAALEPERPPSAAPPSRIRPRSSPPKARRCQAPGAPPTGRSPAKPPRVPASELNKNGKPMRPSTRKASGSAHAIPRRAGSALSLRAGARSGTSRRSSSSAESGTSKTIRRSACLRRDCPPGLFVSGPPRDEAAQAQRHPTPGSGRTRNPRQQNGRITRPIQRSACYRGLPMNVKFNLWCLMVYS